MGHKSIVSLLLYKTNINVNIKNAVSTLIYLFIQHIYMLTLSKYIVHIYHFLICVNKYNIQSFLYLNKYRKVEQH
jgi:hypothetical protein